MDDLIAITFFSGNIQNENLIKGLTDKNNHSNILMLTQSKRFSYIVPIQFLKTNNNKNNKRLYTIIGNFLLYHSKMC